ncbi:MAG: hypothetical protein BMS9Abin23_0544 [Thermodesulfobacteriota bacterium]|nr:MAG: hypothetical protein BMS9Abin23_0544 [Thermodesulfobacteriota bacterium]
MTTEGFKGNADETARVICAKHNIDYQTALWITKAVWEEARRTIATLVGKQQWRQLSFSEKSHVCRVLVRGLLDRRKLSGFLSGETKRLI